MVLRCVRKLLVWLVKFYYGEKALKFPTAHPMVEAVQRAMVHIDGLVSPEFPPVLVSNSGHENQI